jgi:hypothetical protein
VYHWYGIGITNETSSMGHQYRTTGTPIPYRTVPVPEKPAPEIKLILPVSWTQLSFVVITNFDDFIDWFEIID